MISDIQHSAPLGKSDHESLIFDLHCIVCRNKPKNAVLVYHKGDYEALRTSLSTVDWDIELAKCETTTEMWDQFTSILGKQIQKHIPTRNEGTDTKTNKPIWMDKEALKSVRRKHQAWSRYSNTHSSEDHKTYVTCRNVATASCRAAKREFERKLSEEVNTNPKSFWKYIATKCKSRSGIAELKKDDGMLTTSDSEKAQVLNLFFKSVFVKEDTSIIPTLEKQPYTKSLIDILFTSKELADILHSLNPSKSSGPDGMHPRILKECNETLSTPLYRIMRNSLDTGDVPGTWKEGTVSAIYKNKGKRQEACNYRPISLTSVVCKVMERIVRNGLVDHMERNCLFSDHQHGFRRRRSTVTQLLEVMDDWTRALDRGTNIDTIYLDFQKAFDTVPHGRLIGKLKAYGIDGKVLHWITSFLENRSQRVRVNGSLSDWAAVTSGIPQGSVLGPILFVVFINDMPNAITSVCKLFADDTKLYRTIESPNDHVILQDDIYQLSSWSDTWLLRFNTDKCKRMHLGTNPEKYDYKLEPNSTEPIEETLEEKDLGVTIDPKLTFRKHISKTVNKANKVLGIIRRSFDYLDASVLTKLYSALVRPHLEYGDAVWSPHYKKDVTMIENVQRRATKIVPGLRDKSYTERLQELKLFSLAYRRRRGDMVKVFKAVHNLEEIKCITLAPQSAYKTRGHCLRLAKEHCQKNIKLHSFAARVVSDWNSLPEEVVTSTSLPIFKSRLDSSWAALHYVH